ncbi:MAG: zinc-dependent alcohol dehydrogenase family protein [Ignavibacteriales bacterium]|nr:zinc-dependent alcohol dehydrogenase family protein [Ignavibacteriales bacterium]
MLSLQLTAHKQLEIIDYPLRKLEPDELLMKIAAAGICGTDFHLFTCEAKVDLPVIIGHEFCGIVVDRGSTLDGFTNDDHVVIDPNIYCGKCFYCRNGKINFCENLSALGVNINGGLAEYCIVPSSQVYRLPESFPFSRASFTEPLSCCLRGMDIIKIKQGETVAVIGGGTIGLFMVQLAKISGASCIILIEPVDNKKKIGLSLGATHSFHPSEEKLSEQISDLTHGGVDVVIECVGHSSAVNLAFNLTKRGGRILIFGLSPSNSKIEFNLQEAFYKELSINTSLLNPFTFQRAINLLSSNQINVEEFLTKKMNLADVQNLFYSGRNNNIIKYQFVNQ